MSERPDSTGEGDTAAGTGWLFGGTSLVINAADGSTISIDEDGVWFTNPEGKTTKLAGEPDHPMPDLLKPGEIPA